MEFSCSVCLLSLYLSIALEYPVIAPTLKTPIIASTPNISTMERPEEIAYNGTSKALLREVRKFTYALCTLKILRNFRTCRREKVNKFYPIHQKNSQNCKKYLFSRYSKPFFFFAILKSLLGISYSLLSSL